MQKAASIEDLDVQGNLVQLGEQAGQESFIQRRSASPRRLHVVSERRLGSQRAADLAVEIDAMRQNRFACRRSPERPQEPGRGAAIETHHAGIEHRPAVEADGARFVLRAHVRLLQIQPHGAIRVGAEHAVARRLGRRCRRPERGNPRRWEADRRRIETDERVSRSDRHLARAGRARGQPEESRCQPVKQRGSQGGAGIAGKRNEDLAARRVRGQAPGVAAGVYDQNAQTAQDCLRGIQGAPVIARLRFAAQHLSQALEGAAAAADAAAILIRDRQDVPHLRQFADLAAELNLRLVGHCLGGIGGGNDEVIPIGSVRHGRLGRRFS